MAAVYKTLSGNRGVQNGTNGKQASEGPANGVKKNKQRVLLVPSRGITYRHRHLLNDLSRMLPHSRRESKFDTKKSAKLHELNELAELYNCNNILFFEARKGKDLYVWVSKPPNGPTVKFLLQNLHTADELNFVGNCLSGSRPIVSFDAAFESEPFLRLIKELFAQVFGVPQGAKKTKPFVDHVLGFSFVDGRIWVRNYEIKESQSHESSTTAAKKKETDKKETDISLLEIGMRFSLVPVMIQEGAFGGPLIYSNPLFVSPNQIRADLRKRTANRHNARSDQYVDRLAKKGDLGLRTSGGKKMPVDPLDTRELFT